MGRIESLSVKRDHCSCTRTEHTMKKVHIMEEDASFPFKKNNDVRTDLE